MEEKNGRKKTGKKNLGKIIPEKISGNFLLENLPINLFGNFTPENKAQENRANKKAGISATEYMGLFQIAHRLAGGEGAALHWRYMGQLIEAHMQAQRSGHQGQGTHRGTVCHIVQSPRQHRPPATQAAGKPGSTDARRHRITATRHAQPTRQARQHSGKARRQARPQGAHRGAGAQAHRSAETLKEKKHRTP